MKDIYNIAETAIFFHSVPKKSLIECGAAQEGIKLFKERYTVLVCEKSATDKKEKLWIIGNSKRPTSFPRYNKDLAKHIEYRGNKKGWMTGEIFLEFLNALNNKMICKKRKRLLFLDNAPSHPSVTLSNVRLGVPT